MFNNILKKIPSLVIFSLVGFVLTSCDDNTDIISATKASDSNKVIACLADKTNPNFQDPTNGSTPLMIATENNNASIVRILLDNGGNSNLSRSSDGNTALHIATEKGYFQIIKLLIENNAKADIKNKNGDTAITLKDANNNNLLNQVVLGNDLNVVKKLLEKINEIRVGEKLEYSALSIGNNEGNTPLHHAIMNKNDAVAKLLVAKNAAVHLKNKKGEDPVSLAKANKMNHVLFEIYSKKGDLPNAISSIELALTQDENNIELYYNYALVLSQRALIEKENNKLEEAKKSYQASQENLKKISEKQQDYKDSKNIRLNNEENMKVIDILIRTKIADEKQRTELEKKEKEALAKAKELEAKEKLEQIKAQASIKPIETKNPVKIEVATTPIVKATNTNVTVATPSP